VPPVVEAQLQRGRARAGAGVVHEDVQAAEPLRQLVDDVAAAGQVGGVQLRDFGTAAGRAHFGGGLLGAVLVGVPRDADIHAGGGEVDSRGAADAGVGCGDDRVSGSEGHA
jgi:hypothetical protein